MSFKLGPSGNQVTLYRPSNFSIQPKIIEKKGRVASGKLVKDIKAKKHQYVVAYNVLSPTWIDTILTEYNRNEALEFTYEFDGGEETVTVFFQSFNRRKLLTPSELWGNIKLILEEQ